jgi:phosphoenolpyruvate phosphomutase
MIHSRKKNPNEIFEFCDLYKKIKNKKPLVVVPSSFNKVTEEELISKGVNIVIYANQLLRSAYPAMVDTAISILENHRSLECDDSLMPIKDILELIPGTK